MKSTVVRLSDIGHYKRMDASFFCALNAPGVREEVQRLAAVHSKEALIKAAKDVGLGASRSDPNPALRGQWGLLATSEDAALYYVVNKEQQERKLAEQIRGLQSRLKSLKETEERMQRGKV